MSQIEETLSRISKMGGVEGYVITDGEGNVVRQSKSFSDEVAASYAGEVSKLTKRARHLVRDLDPKVSPRRAPAPASSGAHRAWRSTAAPPHTPLCPPPPAPPPERPRVLSPAHLWQQGDSGGAGQQQPGHCGAGVEDVQRGGGGGGEGGEGGHVKRKNNE